MIKKILIIVTIIVLIAGLFSWVTARKSKAGRLIIGKVGEQGIFVSEKRPQYKESDPSKWSPETKKRVEEYENTIKAMDEAHKYTTIALNYRKAGRYEEAIQYHKKAYDIYPAGRSTSSIDLVETYELMRRYHDAIAVIENMLKEGYLNELGQKEAMAMKEKLEREKESKILSTDKLGWPLRKDEGFKKIEGRWYPDIN